MMWWTWPTGPESARRNFVKAIAGLAVIWCSGFVVFLWASGPEQKSLVSVDGESWHPLLRTVLDWLNDPVHLVVTAIVLVLIFGGYRAGKGRTR